MPEYSLGGVEVSRGLRELTWQRSPSCFHRISPKLPNEPLNRDYPTFLCDLSSHSLMPASCAISASWCSHQRRSYVFQCIPFGFSGNDFIMFALPPRRSLMDCALWRARYIALSR